jgi:hypothetical protein
MYLVTFLPVVAYYLNSLRRRQYRIVLQLRFLHVVHVALLDQREQQEQQEQQEQHDRLQQMNENQLATEVTRPSHVASSMSRSGAQSRPGKRAEIEVSEMVNRYDHQCMRCDNDVGKAVFNGSKINCCYMLLPLVFRFCKCPHARSVPVGA